MNASYTYGTMRFWEMFPGLLVWGTFSLALVVSFVQPLWVIVFILLFDVLWLFRVIYFNIFLFLTWKRYRKVRSIDWSKRLKSIPHANETYHLVFLPTYKEPYEVIRATLSALQKQSFPTKRMVVILGGEERDQTSFQEHADRAIKEFGHFFLKCIITIHPKGLSDEIPGKGSNLHWMGEQTDRILQEEFPSIADRDWIASAFDVDTVVHPHYFSYLTCVYRTVENPTHASYQPIVLFSNNIWNASVPVRIGAFGTTFWLLAELARPERLWTFSSHSMPWTMLKDVGFWQKNIVSEDSRIFMQAFLHYHGAYRVEPLFLPVSMDAVTEHTFSKSLRALYVQMRRWAWGIEHLPYIIDGFQKDPLIPFRKKIRYVFNHIEGNYTWATAPVLMFVLGWLPLYLAKDETIALVQQAPFTLEQVMQYAMIGVFLCAFIALTLLPPRPKQVKKQMWIVMALQWVFLPITFIVFGSFPAVDAQTRLMIGKYLGFHVTKKMKK